jgi:hypothetical protein
MLTQENCGIVVSYCVYFFCLIENEKNCGDFAAVAWCSLFKTKIGVRTISERIGLCVVNPHFFILRLDKTNRPGIVKKITFKKVLTFRISYAIIIIVKGRWDVPTYHAERTTEKK